MKLSKVFIYNNDRPESIEAADKFRKSVEADGIVVCHDCKDADLLVCVGGDGALPPFCSELQLSIPAYYRNQHRSSGIFSGIYC